jgi:hypothetical protein
VGAAGQAAQHGDRFLRIARLADGLEADLRMPRDPARDPYGTGGLAAAAEVRAAKEADLARLEAESADAGGMGGSAGARAVEIPENKMASSLGAGELLASTSPLTRVAYSPFQMSRDALHRLVDNPMTLKQNEAGVGTGPVGGSAERQIKIQGEARLYRAIRELDEAFAEYRYGKPDAFAAPMRAGIGRMAGNRQHMTFKEFKEEVGRAMRRGDTHANPMIDRAAKAMRKELFDPLKKLAQQHKLLPEDEKLIENYLTRVYNVDKIQKQYPRFTSTLVEWLKMGQARAEKELAEAEARRAELIRKQGGEDGGPSGGTPPPEPPPAPKSPEAVREEFAARTEERAAEHRDAISDIDAALKAAKGDEKDALLKEKQDLEARLKDTEEELKETLEAKTGAETPLRVTDDPNAMYRLAQVESAVDEAIADIRGILPEDVAVRMFDDPSELGERLAGDVRAQTDAGNRVDAFFDDQTATVYLARHALD